MEGIGLIPALLDKNYKPNSDMPPKERRLMELINGAESEDEAEKQIEEAKAKKPANLEKLLRGNKV
ncbi:MAG: hypothetical protein CK547_07065 [Chitinophagaceae bacterium]|nr:MAG: hypothetical protein CK547_07065 [Chitinophagaceae bacterium]